MSIDEAGSCISSWGSDSTGTEAVLSIMQVVTGLEGNCSSTVSGNSLEGWGSDLGFVDESTFLEFVESSLEKLSSLEVSNSSGFASSAESGGSWDDYLSSTDTDTLSALHEEELSSWVCSCLSERWGQWVDS